MSVNMKRKLDAMNHSLDALAMRVYKLESAAELAEKEAEIDRSKKFPEILHVAVEHGKLLVAYGRVVFLSISKDGEVSTHFDKKLQQDAYLEWYEGKKPVSLKPATWNGVEVRLKGVMLYVGSFYIYNFRSCTTCSGVSTDRIKTHGPNHCVTLY